MATVSVVATDASAQKAVTQEAGLDVELTIAIVPQLTRSSAAHNYL